MVSFNRVCIAVIILHLVGFSPVLSASNKKKLTLTVFDMSSSRMGFERLEKAYRNLGIELSKVDLPADRSIRSVNAGTYDGEAVRVKVKASDYPNLIQVPTPILEGGFYVYKRKGFPFDPKKEKTVTVGVQRGVLAVKYLPPNYKIGYQVSLLEQLFKMLDIKRVNLIYADEVSADVEIKKLGMDEKVERIDPPIARVYGYHYLNKRHHELVPLIDEQIKILNRTENHPYAPKAPRG
ncbi:hypothetical protein [Pseudobacteriovorax antillogorgiicola]|uniref:Amino acid ABC transporter substrate-binding protein, PAAT family n=1 Tax=Pseudobacteriovorax antillogorgiicola TaxID=1513793 RepID=A0A1Y6CNG3_9BACT|nr:hypothetical protein [Pseudobacteriovorax antillogorgiicola]TCS46933.1 amino acid ABC transporter substrate-binding protein (PAAT family) [Pseudobacteriovorax antillogorgiicola]SMF64331.1 amino acid ABC transporter substrate-binding protein, PAAT family [Pseudobacteriovorax antillogorgiicola]